MDQRNFTRKCSHWNFYGPKELYKKVFRGEFAWKKLFKIRKLMKFPYEKKLGT